jgi:hypothetical protein
MPRQKFDSLRIRHSCDYDPRFFNVFHGIDLL